MNDILLAACRAHAPQFDRMDSEIKKYAIEQMRAALIVAVANLVSASRAVLDDGGDHDGALEAALEPFDELIPCASTVESDISAAIRENSPSARSAPSFDPLLGSGGLPLEQGNAE